MHDKWLLYVKHTDYVEFDVQVYRHYQNSCQAAGLLKGMQQSTIGLISSLKCACTKDSKVARTP